MTQSLFKVKEEPEDDWDQVAEAEIREANRYPSQFYFKFKRRIQRVKVDVKYINEP